MGDYVYDPSLLLKFKKDIYYEMYCPTKVKKYTKEQYMCVGDNKDLYEDIRDTSLDDFKPGGKRRTDLCVMIPVLQGLAKYSNDGNFKKDLFYYLDSIEYDEAQINEELNTRFKEFFK